MLARTLGDIASLLLARSYLPTWRRSKVIPLVSDRIVRFHTAA